MIWLQDFKSPLYISLRVGKNGKLFKLYKFRSMIFNADISGVDSTSNDDKRITSIGKVIRKFKIDELSQLFNVLIGNMSFVGPRPNVKYETDLYSKQEKRLLSIKPGITDFSSIVFSDEGSILANSNDPDLKYNRIIRPWKSRLGLVYVENSGIILDIILIFLTVLALFSKKIALNHLCSILKYYNVDDELIQISSREIELYEKPPPGLNKIVQSR